MESIGSEEEKSSTTDFSENNDDSLRNELEEGNNSENEHSSSENLQSSENVDTFQLKELSSIKLKGFKRHFKALQFSGNGNIDNDEETPLLHRAILAGRKDILRWLLHQQFSKGVALAHVNSNNESCSELATKQGDLGMLKLIVKQSKNADISKVRDDSGGTLLHQATSHGVLNIVKWLLKRDWTLAKSCDLDGRTPLHLAALLGHSRIAKHIVISCYLSAYICDNYGATPLYHAASGGHIGCIYPLLNQRIKGATNDLTGLTPLHVATMNGHLRIAKVLLKECGRKSLRQQTKDGDTVFHLAAENGHWHILQLLLKQRGSKKVVNLLNDKGHSALDVSLLSEKPECTLLLRKLCAPTDDGKVLKIERQPVILRHPKPTTTRGNLTPSLFRQKHRLTPLTLPEKNEETVIQVERSLDENIDADSIDWSLQSPLAVIQDYNGFLHGSRKSLGSDNWGELDSLTDALNSNFTLKEKTSDVANDTVSIDSGRRLGSSRVCCEEESGLLENSAKEDTEENSDENEGFALQNREVKLFTLELNEVEGGDFFNVNDSTGIRNQDEHILPIEIRPHKEIILEQLARNTEDVKELKSEHFDCEENSDMANNPKTNIPQINAENKDGSEQKNTTSYPVSPGTGRRGFRLDYGAYTKAVLTRRETKSRVPILYTDESTENGQLKPPQKEQNLQRPGKTVIHVNPDK